MANLTKEDIRSVIEIIKELYLEDMIPWICGYSGGKDSTAVVQLVWYALQELPREKLKKTVHVRQTAVPAGTGQIGAPAQAALWQWCGDWCSASCR